MTQQEIPIHIGLRPPHDWHQPTREDATPWMHEIVGGGDGQSGLAWARLGFEPRWLGVETADCAAAIEPSLYSGRGAAEFERFRRGASSRGEPALVLSAIGNLNDGTQSLFDACGNLVISHDGHTNVHSNFLGKGASVRTAPDLCDADRQLALRLLSCNPAPTWSLLSLGGAEFHTVYGVEKHEPVGTLMPILVTDLDESVAAVWISPDGAERRYLVPAEASLQSMLEWLLEQGLPEFVPAGIRRARRQLSTDPSLMTTQERTARQALGALAADYEERRRPLTTQLEDAQAAANTIREGLLYGSGGQLVAAVQAAFEAAGITAKDLDDLLGNTSNADLLCTLNGRSILVEVKSATGNAPERAYQDLLRHMREWASTPGSTPVDGGALVISHELRRDPSERSTVPYARPEFLAAQEERVISALELFAAWKDNDVEAIRGLLFVPSTGSAAASDVKASAPVGCGRRWLPWLRKSGQRR